MAIVVGYEPVGAIGALAISGGLGEYQKYREQQAMKAAEFRQRQQEFAAENSLAQRRQSFQEGQAAEDNRFRAISSFNDLQQDQISNAMRERQQAEGAMRQRAEFGMDQQRMALGARQQQDQSAFKWYDRATDAYFQAAGMAQQGYESGQGRQLQRDLLQGRQEGYDRRNEFLQEMQDQRLGAQEENIRLRYNLQEQQDLRRIDQGIHQIRQGVRSGGLLPQAAQARIGEMEGQRQQIMTGAQQRQRLGADPEQSIKPMEQYQQQTYERPDGVTIGFNRYGEPNVLHDRNKAFDDNYNAVFKALTVTTKGDDPDKPGTEKTTITYPKPEAIRDHMLQQEALRQEMLKARVAAEKPAPPPVSQPPPYGPQHDPQQPQGPPRILGSQQPSWVAPQGAVGQRQQAGSPSGREAQQAAFQDLQRKREKLSDDPRMQREVDWLESVMAKYPRLMDAPPDIRAKVRALLKTLDGV